MSVTILKNETIDLIRQEMASIPAEYHDPMPSTHHGYAVLQEEVDELWEVIKNGEKQIKKQLRLESHLEGTVQHYHKRQMRDEAVQVAAMAIRIVQELTVCDCKVCQSKL
jgi:hypothetical protein